MESEKEAESSFNKSDETVVKPSGENCVLSEQQILSSAMSNKSEITVEGESANASNSSGACLNYSDESYSTHRHHFIGSGLYLTDDISDLPPRYYNKIMRVLTTSAERLGVPLDYLLSQMAVTDGAPFDNGKYLPSSQSKDFYPSNGNSESNCEMKNHLKDSSQVNLKSYTKSNYINKKSEALQENVDKIESLANRTCEAIAKKQFRPVQQSVSSHANVDSHRSKKHIAPFETSSERYPSESNVTNVSEEGLVTRNIIQTYENPRTFQNDSNCARTKSDFTDGKKVSSMNVDHLYFYDNLRTSINKKSRYSSHHNKNKFPYNEVAQVNASIQDIEIKTSHSIKTSGDSTKRDDLFDHSVKHNSKTNFSNIQPRKNMFNYETDSDKAIIAYKVENKIGKKKVEGEFVDEAILQIKRKLEKKHCSDISLNIKTSTCETCSSKSFDRNIKNQKPFSKKQGFQERKKYVPIYKENVGNSKSCKAKHSASIHKEQFINNSHLSPSVSKSQDPLESKPDKENTTKLKNNDSKLNSYQLTQTKKTFCDKNISKSLYEHLEEGKKNIDCYSSDELYQNTKKHTSGRKNNCRINIDKTNAVNKNSAKQIHKGNKKECGTKVVTAPPNTSKTDLKGILHADANFQKTLKGINEVNVLAPTTCVENGFFIQVNVSENPRDLEYWRTFFKGMFKHNEFDIDHCCKFSGTLILSFHKKKKASDAECLLKKNKSKKLATPHLITVSKLKFHLKKPCDCENKIQKKYKSFIIEYSDRYISIHDEKIKAIENKLKALKSPSDRESKLALEDELNTLRDSKTVFINYTSSVLSKMEHLTKFLDLQKLKNTFVRECNCFHRCLPVYSKKEQIMELVRYYSVSIVIAETGSGKSTQLVQMLLQSSTVNTGYIVCVQPRKISALSLARYVSGQLGSSLGKIVGYDLGRERKISAESKIIYMTDYTFLKKFIQNNKLSGISCVVLDEAHERSLYMDLLFGMLKQCLPMRPDLRIIITSATIDPTMFINFFQIPKKSILDIPGRSHPVEVIWSDKDISSDSDYVQQCVHTAYEIHKKYKEGNILVFLTCSSEIEEAINMFRKKCHRDEVPHLLGFHGKSDIQEQLQIFEESPKFSRKIIFATNVAETSLTIPGVKFVVDSGMAKEMSFNPKNNKNFLKINFISKSSAEQRKGRAGRTQSGVCYRMYSKKNFEKCMPDRSLPEILKTNLQKAFLKIFELGIQPKCFDFVESPPKETIIKSVNSLEIIGAVENNKLTELGKRLACLPVEPQFSKLIFRGIDVGIGYEMAIIAALVTESGKLFLRNEENKNDADKRKRNVCLPAGDLCTYLHLYKKWLAYDPKERYSWCVENYINSKALKCAQKTVQDIIDTLRTELSVFVRRRYNNSAFQLNFEEILLECFCENICIFSGHPKLGYISPFVSESLIIHPSSAISYLGIENPDFLIYCTIMETSRNFAVDVTQVTEKAIQKAYEKGYFQFQLDKLRSLQSSSKSIGPYGEVTLIRYILGKEGSKIRNLEAKIKSETKSFNFHIDVVVNQGLIVVHSERRLHDILCHYVDNAIKEANAEMSKEEYFVNILNSSLHMYLTTGGVINDVIIPGEFRELEICGVQKNEYDNVISSLKSYGDIISINSSTNSNICKFSVIYKKVIDAECALQSLKRSNSFTVRSVVRFSKTDKESSLPLYRLKAQWCRWPCSGTGWVEFFLEEHCVCASGVLNGPSPLRIGNNTINFTPAHSNVRQLYMSNLPSFASKEMVKEALLKHFPEIVKVKDIILCRKMGTSSLDNDVKRPKEKLQQLFARYTSPKKFFVDVKTPSKDEAVWNAIIYFKCVDDGERAYWELKDKAEIDSQPVSLKLLLKSNLHCSTDVYQAVESGIKEIEKQFKVKKICNFFSVTEVKHKQRFKNISFTCSDIDSLNSMQCKLIRLLQGDSIDCSANSKYSFLFNRTNKKLIADIQSSTGTYVIFNPHRKIIFIYGSTENRRRAAFAIHRLVIDVCKSDVRVFNLNNSCIPAGFLKYIYSKYGYGLQGLIEEFELKDAFVDTIANTLTLSGPNHKILEAEEVLESICSKLYEGRNQKEGEVYSDEICPVCMDPVAQPFQRLEACGHAVCKECLTFQIRSKTVPLKCAKQNCEKLLFVEDIKKILSEVGNQDRNSFYAAALQHHFSSNVGKIGYCITPDCQMVYRVSKNNPEFECLDCGNSICTVCQTTYHQGMSCKAYQEFEKDADVSLKMWMQENLNNRKQCPNCQAAIEKNLGCNHMQCGFCQSHFCWLCLTVFPEDKDVYDHLPYCSENQR